MYISIGQAALMTGLSISTFRRWELEGKFLPCYRSCGGHRRYSVQRIEQELLFKHTETHPRTAVLYARVSSYDQKLDLERQKKRLIKYGEERKFAYELITDLGSGLNYNKKGLKKLIRMICSRQLSELIVTHKDRLLRFGSALLFQLCDFYGTKVTILEDKMDQTFEQELVADVIEIMTVFTAKMYGKRAHKNKKAVAN